MVASEHVVGKGPAPPLAAKRLYSREARRKLLKVRRRLKSVDAKLSNAVTTGLMQKSVPLANARRSVDKHLVRADARLDALRKSGIDDWFSERDAVEHAWEDLSRAVRLLLAHLSQENSIDG